MLGRRSVFRGLSGVSLAALLALGVPPGGTAVPPTPPNPTDQDIEAGVTTSREMAARVGELTGRLAEAESKLVGLIAEVELAMEDANKARVDIARAERDAARAQGAAEVAAGELRAAGERIEQERRKLDEFTASSYRQGSAVGSLTAFAGARNPEELLDRAELLDVVSVSQRDLLDELQRARVERANKESRARAAVRVAETKRAEAGAARAAAEAAEHAAVAAQEMQGRQASQLEAQRAQAEEQLVAARGEVAELRGQRHLFNDWLEVKDQEETAAQLAGDEDESEPESGTSSDSVETVIQRALSQLGTSYAWGGGNSRGPSRGIRDGGVADSHGDYLKTGFDCSGLMIYAFAGAGIELDHYSGYQYQAGEQVPVSQRRRGDMLFWQSGGRIHHVALYLGGGRMVEAPYSGSKVRVTAVRYGGLAPYAVRMF